MAKDVAVHDGFTSKGMSLELDGGGAGEDWNSITPFAGSHAVVGELCAIVGCERGDDEMVHVNVQRVWLVTSTVDLPLVHFSHSHHMAILALIGGGSTALASERIVWARRSATSTAVGTLAHDELAPVCTGLTHIYFMSAVNRIACDVLQVVRLRDGRQ